MKSNEIKWSIHKYLQFHSFPSINHSSGVGERSYFSPGVTYTVMYAPIALHHKQAWEIDREGSHTCSGVSKASTIRMMFRYRSRRMISTSRISLLWESVSSMYMFKTSTDHQQETIHNGRVLTIQEFEGTSYVCKQSMEWAVWNG